MCALCDLPPPPLHAHPYAYVAPTILPGTVHPPLPPPPQSKPEAQIEFTKSKANASVGNLWHLPDRNYTFSVQCMGGGGGDGGSSGSSGGAGAGLGGPAPSPFAAQFFGLDTNGADSNARKKHPTVREDLKWCVVIREAQGSPACHAPRGWFFLLPGCSLPTTPILCTPSPCSPSPCGCPYPVLAVTAPCPFPSSALPSLVVLLHVADRIPCWL